MPTTYHIVDNVTSEPDRYLKTWNSSTGLVTSTTTDYAQALPFATRDMRDAAIALVNECAGNDGNFIGHIPPPPPKH